MFVSDSAVTVSRERTPEGFLRVRARIGRVGLHDYTAREIGGPPGLAPDATVRVYRPAEEVFDAASMASFAGKPVTLDHPPAMVDSGNWKRFAVGHAGQEVIRDGDHLATELVITDAAAVARAESGAQLSNGYWADFVFGAGLTPEGESYDALQRNIRGNHIALVHAGRCGASCGLDQEVADAGPAHGCGCALDPSQVPPGVPQTSAAADRLQAQLDAALAAHRRDLDVRDGEIAALKAAVPDAAVLDALLDQRIAAIKAAHVALGPSFDPRGQSTSAIRHAVVCKLLGAEQVRDRGEDYLAAAFDTLVALKLGADKPNNPLASHLAAGLADGASSRDAALTARDRFLTQAWKGDPALSHIPGAS